MVGQEGQEVESVWIFERVLSLGVQKHSYKQDCLDKFLALGHKSLTVFGVLFFKDISCAFIWRPLTGEVRKAPRAIHKPWWWIGKSNVLHTYSHQICDHQQVLVIELMIVL